MSDLARALWVRGRTGDFPEPGDLLTVRDEDGRVLSSFGTMRPGDEGRGTAIGLRLPVPGTVGRPVPGAVARRGRGGPLARRPPRRADLGGPSGRADRLRRCGTSAGTGTSREVRSLGAAAGRGPSRRDRVGERGVGRATVEDDGPKRGERFRRMGHRDPVAGLRSRVRRRRRRDGPAVRPPRPFRGGPRRSRARSRPAPRRPRAGGCSGLSGGGSLSRFSSPAPCPWPPAP